MQHIEQGMSCIQLSGSADCIQCIAHYFLEHCYSSLVQTTQGTTIDGLRGEALCIKSKFIFPFFCCSPTVMGIHY